MITQSGQSIWPKRSKFYAGDNVVPSIEDIGFGLSRIVRFAGQTKRFYNVLNHTLTVADIVPKEFMMPALLHDAPEAVVSDVPSPWKTQAAKDYEHELLERMTKVHWGEDRWPWSDEERDVIAQADYIALAAEAHVLGHAEAEKWWPWAPHSHMPMFDLAIALTKQRFATSLLQAADPAYGSLLYLEYVDTALGEAA